MKLEISLFRFDYKTDYLPYYTKHFIKIQEEKTLLDLLNTLRNIEEFSFCSEENFPLVINGIYTNSQTSLSSIVQTFGKDLKIEPISIRRASKDLLINDEDFKEKLQYLEKFASLEQIKKYKEYKIYFYASNTINFEYEYIGDALLLFANDLIENKRSNEDEILDILSSFKIGASYHTSLEKRVFDFDLDIEKKIKAIQRKLKLRKSIDEQKFEVDANININFQNFVNKEIVHDFKDFNIAYYEGLKQDEQTLELLDKLEAKIIKSDAFKFDLAKSTFHLNSDFTLKIASSIMLEAFDNSADFLLVDNIEDFKIFDANRKSLERLCGRAIILPVIHKSELALLACGLHEEAKETLKKHKVNPEIV